MRIKQKQTKGWAKMNKIKAVPINLNGNVDYAPGSIVSKTLLDKKAGSLTLFAFDMGQKLSEHVSPYDASVLILDGEAVLMIGGTPVRAAAGELLVMPANIPHAVLAEKRFKMLLVMIK